MVSLTLYTANSLRNMAGVLLGTGNGTFGSAMLYPLSSSLYPFALAVADVNADGYKDLLLATAGTNNPVCVLLGAVRVASGL
jgi:hypothetical protein